MELRKRMKDLAGLTFGSLTAIRPIGLSKQGTVIWEFQCVCGELIEKIGNNIVSLAKQQINPKVPSCGCIKVAVNTALNTTHGFSKHPLLYTWQSMKQRCYNPKHPEYPRYGAKGVTVCDSWKNDSAAFIQWALDNGWEKGKHLDKDVLSDRLNQKREYSPQTCCFISANRNVGYSGSRENFAHNTRIKLTPSDILEIKKLYQTKQLNQYELAQKYGVSQASIWRAIHRA